MDSEEGLTDSSLLWNKNKQNQEEGNLRRMEQEQEKWSSWVKRGGRGGFGDRQEGDFSPMNYMLDKYAKPHF